MSQVPVGKHAGREPEDMLGVSPSAPRGNAARLGYGLLIIVVAMNLILATVVLAERLPSHASLPVLPALRRVGDAARSALTVAPVTAAFVERALGRGALGRIEPSPAQPVTNQLPPRSGPTPPPPPPRSPSPTPPPPRNPVVDVLVPEPATLSIALVADRRVVDDGDDITYDIVVRNIGDTDFRGDFTITSHVPFGTTSSQPARCNVPGPADPDPVCREVTVPVPGQPESDSVHPISSRNTATIRSGQHFVTRFVVRVNPGTAPGTEIRNHAHLEVVGEPRQTSSIVVVTVR